MVSCLLVPSEYQSKTILKFLKKTRFDENILPLMLSYLWFTIKILEKYKSYSLLYFEKVKKFGGHFLEYLNFETPNAQFLWLT